MNIFYCTGIQKESIVNHSKVEPSKCTSKEGDYGLSLRSLFHSTSATVAKPRLPVAFSGQIEETDELFSHVRLQDLIKDDS